MGHRPIHLLLVEDNPGDVRLFKELIEGDFRVMVAETGAEALDVLFLRGKFHAQPIPDLVVLDLNVPLLTGLEVLNAIRSNSKITHLPVIVWSASSHAEDVLKAYRLGCCAYMVKPLDLPEIRTRLKAFADFWLHTVQYPTQTPAT